MKKLNLVVLLFVVSLYFISGCDDTYPEDEYNATLGNPGEVLSEYSCPSQEAYEACRSKDCGDCSHTSGPNLYQ